MKPIQTLNESHVYFYSKTVPKKLEIKVGTLATLHVGSDDYSYIVTKISPTGKTVYIVRAIKLRGKWKAHPHDPERIEVREYSKGRWKQHGGGSVNWHVTFGAAVEYRDRSF